MKSDIQTIPELLRRCNGNKSAVGRIVGLSRQSVGTYSNDVDGIRHAIVNGVLMVAQGNRGKHNKRVADEV